MTKNEAEVILNLEGNYDSDLLRKQYYKMAKKYHPDINSNLSDDEKTKNMQEINSAYEYLKQYLNNNGVGNVSRNSSNNRWTHYSYYYRSTNRTTNYSYNTTGSKYYSEKQHFNREEGSPFSYFIFKKTLMEEIRSIDILKRKYQLENNEYAINMCEIYILKLQKYNELIFNIANLDESGFLFEINEIQNRTIMDVHKDYKERLNYFYSEKAKKLYFEKWKLNKDNILNLKKMELKIQSFLEIINEVNKVEKQEKGMYLNSIKNEIEEIINTYSYYAYYEQVKDKILILKNITLKNITSIFNRKYKDIVFFEADIALKINEMKESVDKIFNEYANNISFFNSQEPLKKRSDDTLKKECIENNENEDRWEKIKIKRFK